MIIESAILIGCGIRLFKLLHNNTNTIRKEPISNTNMNEYVDIDPAARYYQKEVEKMFRPGWENDPRVQKLQKEIYVNMGRNKHGIKMSG